VEIRKSTRSHKPHGAEIVLQYIVYCCWLLFELIYIFLFLVETKGKTLEETAAMFDGKEVVQNIENVGNEAAHRSRRRFGGFEKKDEIELACSRGDSQHSAVLTIHSERDDHFRRSESRDSTNFSEIKRDETPSTPSAPRSSNKWDV
jgi:hypothetical protein